MSRKSESIGTLLPSTYLTVLTLIGDGAKYGYEIVGLIEERGYTEWVDIKMPSVYKALNELEKRKLISGKKSESGVRPSKKTYTLTSKGQIVLKDQITRCLRDPPRVNTLFDLGISAMFMLSQEEVLEALKEHVKGINRTVEFLSSNTRAIEDIEELKKTEPMQKIGNRFVADIQSDEPLDVVHALFDRPKVMLECRREWLFKLIKKIEMKPERFGLKSEKEMN
jgi:DNA-binding PadR family transcriptional regulator